MLGEMPVWYLFLGGSGAGLLLVTGVTMLFVPSWDRMVSHGIAGDLYGVGGVYGCLARLFVPACATAAVLLVVGISCLALDLGATDRAVLLFFSPRLTFISAGAWLLSAAVLVDVALLAAWASEPSRRAQAWARFAHCGGITRLCGCGVHGFAPAIAFSCTALGNAVAAMPVRAVIAFVRCGAYGRGGEAIGRSGSVRGGCAPMGVHRRRGAARGGGLRSGFSGHANRMCEVGRLGHAVGAGGIASNTACRCGRMGVLGRVRLRGPCRPVGHGNCQHPLQALAPCPVRPGRLRACGRIRHAMEHHGCRGAPYFAICRFVIKEGCHAAEAARRFSLRRR